MTVDRLPPHDLDAEQAVLGSCLIDDDAVWKVRHLAPGDFYRDRHAHIWQAITALADRMEVLNQISVAYELSHAGRLEVCGGSDYLGRLVAEVPTSAHVDHYAQIVRECAQRRALISLAGRLAQDAYEGVALSDVQAKYITALSAMEARLGGLRPLSAILDFHEATIRDWLIGQNDGTGVPTGFVDVDDTLGLLQPGSLAVVAARPSMGKTQFVLNVAAHVAKECGPVAFFSLEMDELSLGKRILCAKAGINSFDVRKRKHLYSDEEARLDAAFREARTFGWWIDDTPGLDTGGIRSRVTRFMAEHKPPRLLIVDYQDLLGDADDDEVRRRGAICKALRLIGRHHQLPVMLVAQLNRDVEKRSDKRPMLSDLRGSGEIEQVIDYCLFLYRASYYSESANPTDLEVLIAKNRIGGRTGSVKLYYDIGVGRMGNAVRA